MRDEWIDRLSAPYSADESDSPDRVVKRLGLDIPTSGRMAEAIFEDLDSSALGIGWWPQVDVKRRILIGDHLLQAAYGVIRNLIEARVHQLELEDFLDRESAHVNEALLAGAGSSDIFGPPRTLSVSFGVS